MGTPTGFRCTTDMRPWVKALAKVEGGQTLAVAETLNTVGSFAHAESIRNLRKDFTLRNKYTEGSMRAYPVNYKRSNGKYREIGKMKFITGTVSLYLPLQESGGLQKAHKKYIAMPTLAGRGGSTKRAIPRGLSIEALGERAFVLSPSRSGAPRMRHGKAVPYTLQSAALFYRKGRRLIKLRLLDQKTQRVKPVHWHTAAMAKYSSYAVLSANYIQAAKRILGGDTTAF